ncbi:WD40-repeat-containing domain protein [Podospora appendiculata]|uniref:Probable cytosolic iron-sulfur protein assembly protein 1 n=1 Tax=Podospora appendiculata TaxID=314037 RepID=A0AAE0X2U3_9PEZI|nr:WD40-repeat-containing domain protein [Podospora appendiculata]
MEAAAHITPLAALKPDLYQRAWASVPHPTLPLLATTHANQVTVFSLTTLSKHSVLAGGHTRSVRAVTWQPAQPATRLRLVTGSFDASAGLWTWDAESAGLEREVTTAGAGVEEDDDDKDWEFNLVLEGHEHEVKGVAFNPSGQYLATCSRDKSVWIWEDVGGAGGEDDEWETVAVLSEHDGDVKAVAWCPDVAGRSSKARYSADVLASASYDNTVRIWREDVDGEWICVAVLEGHDGTVWGLQWEPSTTKGDNKFPRLMTWSADATVRIWTLREEEDEEDQGEDVSGGSRLFRSGLGGIPNTMRRSMREEWECTAVLPRVHTRAVYSATWSADTGLVASAGSDGLIVVYAEDGDGDADVKMASPSPQPETAAAAIESSAENGAEERRGAWRVLGKVDNAHGPYEVNHITWCKRFDAGAERKGEEEMLVTTGDDGVIRPWQVRISS